MKCIHGLDKDFCYNCNNFSVTTLKQNRKNEVSSELLNKYDELKEKFRSYRDIWSQEEFFAVYVNIKDVIGTKLEKTMIYKTAIELGRTISAVKWAISHIFSEKQYHRGRTVIEFRKMFGLNKESV